MSTQKYTFPSASLADIRWTPTHISLLLAASTPRARLVITSVNFFAAIDLVCAGLLANPADDPMALRCTPFGQTLLASARARLKADLRQAETDAARATRDARKAAQRSGLGPKRLLGLAFVFAFLVALAWYCP